MIISEHAAQKTDWEIWERTDHNAEFFLAVKSFMRAVRVSSEWRLLSSVLIALACPTLLLLVSIVTPKEHVADALAFFGWIAGAVTAVGLWLVVSSLRVRWLAVKYLESVQTHNEYMACAYKSKLGKVCENLHCTFRRFNFHKTLKDTAR